jgi:hypothetical protein
LINKIKQKSFVTAIGILACFGDINIEKQSTELTMNNMSPFGTYYSSISFGLNNASATIPNTDEDEDDDEDDEDDYDGTEADDDIEVIEVEGEEDEGIDDPEFDWEDDWDYDDDDDNGDNDDDYQEDLMECLNEAQDQRIDCFNDVNDKVSAFSTGCNINASVSGMVVAEFTAIIGGIATVIVYGAYCYAVGDAISTADRSDCNSDYNNNKSSC